MSRVELAIMTSGGGRRLQRILLVLVMAGLLHPSDAGADIKAECSTTAVGVFDAGCPGIRPGARISPSGCTMNFVFTDDTDLYVGTAGHCVKTGDRVGALGVGEFGTVAFRIVNLPPCLPIVFGCVERADDFALIRVDADKRELVNPQLCHWGGPTGLHTGAAEPGALLHEYGWGFVTEHAEETRRRTHVLKEYNGLLVTWFGAGSGGDSGAPVITEDGRAIAVHTKGITPAAGAVESGPHIQRVMSLAAQAGFDVDLVTASR